MPHTGFPVNPVQNRSEDLPCHVKLVITDEIRMIALECVEDERLVCLWDLRLGESLLIGHVELHRDGTCGEARQFRVHLHPDRFRRLDAEDKLIATDIVEDPLDGVFILNPDLDLAFVQS